MPTLRHLAINADDVQRAKAFYETVFGWRFEPWGPPDYYQAHEAGEGFIMRAAGPPRNRSRVRRCWGSRRPSRSTTSPRPRPRSRPPAAGSRGAADLHRGRRPAGLLPDPEGNLFGRHAVRQRARFELRRRLSASARRRRPIRTATRLDRHDHPWGQLAFCNSGVMRVISDAAAWLSPPTRAIWLPAGRRARDRHEAARWRPASSTWRRNWPRRCRREPRVVEVVPLLRELILHILKLPHAASGRARAGPARRALLVDLLLAGAAASTSPCRCRATAARSPSPIGCRPRRPSPPALADLARRAGASLRTLQRLFPAETGPDAGGLAAEGAADHRRRGAQRRRAGRGHGRRLRLREPQRLHHRLQAPVRRHARTLSARAAGSTRSRALASRSHALVQRLVALGEAEADDRGHRIGLVEGGDRDRRDAGLLHRAQAELHVASATPEAARSTLRK